MTGTTSETAATASEPVAESRARAAALDVRIWLGAIVLVSVAARILIGRKVQAPWIMVDELVYSELAKSVAAHGHFLVRGVSSTGYGFVYPTLIAPAWRLFGPMPRVYAEAKTINAVLMSLAAVPAYFLGRRVLPVRHALVAAALAVLVPSMLYTGMLMTENAFYPVFLAASLALVAALEQPTWRRQALLAGACLLAFETRAQAVALVAAAATAPLLLAAFDRKGVRRGLRPWAAFYALAALGALGVAAAAAVRGRSTLSLLGAYEAATSSRYTAGGVLHFFLYHVAEIDLYVGVIPFAALVAIWLTPGRGSPGRRAFAAGTLAVSFWLVAEVGAFASQSFVDRIEERNTFYLAPFALIALVGLAVDGVVPVSRRVVLGAAAIAVVLPPAIPFTRFITTSAVSDTFALLPWWWVQDHWISLGEVQTGVLACSLAAGAAFVLVPRRHALWLVVPVVGYFVLTSVVVENGRHGIVRFSTASYWAGTHAARPDWVDRAVGRDASVAVLWSGAAGSLPLWEDEFFNRSLGPVYELGGARPDNLPGTAVSRAANGWLVDSSGASVAASYVLAPAGTDLAGKVIARDPVGVDLYRVGGPLVIRTHVTGLYPNDTWSGPEVRYQRVECTGGTLAVTLAGDPSLFGRQPQTVTALERGRRVGSVAIPPGRQVVMRVPLRPDANDTCALRFRLGRTLVPARVEPGQTDTRPLGAHFLGFEVKGR